MSENYSLKELNEWADKVIDCISKWADEMNKAFNGTPTSIKIEKLDFSEHDKVFEDEIATLKEKLLTTTKTAEQNRRRSFVLEMKNQDLKNITKGYEDKIVELKKDYKTASELLGKYQQENESLKKRVVELENFSCQAEQETESLVEKLKQRIAGLEKELEEWKEEARAVKKNRDEQLKNFREAVEPYVDIGHMHETIEDLKQHIAELESKETEKPTKINLNDRIKVKLTPLGAEIYYHQYDDIYKDYPKMKKHLQSSLPKVDENGYTEFQLWHFVELYGEHIGMCKKNVISPLDIIIVE